MCRVYWCFYLQEHESVDGLTKQTLAYVMGLEFCVQVFFSHVTFGINIIPSSRVLNCG